jgi:hypothetical protein
MANQQRTLWPFTTKITKTKQSISKKKTGRREPRGLGPRKTRDSIYNNLVT